MYKRKIFRDEVAPLDRDDKFPRCLRDYVPECDVTRVIDEVIDAMDLSELEAKYHGGGAPAYLPKMMLKLHVMGLRIGMPSSRKIETACRYDTRFMYLARKAIPNHRTLSTFRRENKATFKHVFKETIRICVKLGLVNLEEVSVDGSKLEANVSGKATYSVERREKEEAKLDALAQRLYEEAERVDAEEDQRLGQLSGDELPEALADPEERKRQIAKAMRSVKSKQERNAKAKDVLKETSDSTVCVTDTDSKVMKTKSGNRPAYNAQAAVDAKCHVIIAADVTQDENDLKQLGPVLNQVVENTGKMPDKVAVDSGYSSDETFDYIEQNDVDAYVALRPGQISLADYEYDAENDLLRGCTEATQGQVLRFYRERERHGKRYKVYRDPSVGKYGIERWLTMDAAGQTERLHKMHRKLRTIKGRATYSRRKHTIEPVFGHIKGSLGTRRLLLKGLDGAKIQFLLACCCHNIGKIVTFGNLDKAKLAENASVLSKNRRKRVYMSLCSAFMGRLMTILARTTPKHLLATAAA